MFQQNQLGCAFLANFLAILLFRAKQGPQVELLMVIHSMGRLQALPDRIKQARENTLAYFQQRRKKVKWRWDLESRRRRWQPCGGCRRRRWWWGGRYHLLAASPLKGKNKDFRWVVFRETGRSQDPATFISNVTTIRLYHPLDGVTNPKNKLLHLSTTDFFEKGRMF